MYGIFVIQNVCRVSCRLHLSTPSADAYGSSEQTLLLTPGKFVADLL